MSETNPNDWQETLTGELLLFNLLGRIVYKYPDDEEKSWLKSLIEEDLFAEAPFAADQEGTKVGLTLLQKWAKDGLSADSFGRIQADHTRLFIGPGKIIVPAWESVYFSDERLTFQEKTLEVRNWYRRYNLEPENIYHEPDDHIGLEFIFIAHLAQLDLAALENKDQQKFSELLQAQKNFLSEHLLKWGRVWCDLLAKNAKTDFYHGIALLAQGALEELSMLFGLQIPSVVVKWS